MVHVGGGGASFSTVRGYLQHCGGCLVQWGITSVQWRITSVLWEDNINTVEVAQYSGDNDLIYYKFSKNLEIFSRAYFASKSHRPHHMT